MSKLQIVDVQLNVRRLLICVIAVFKCCTIILVFAHFDDALFRNEISNIDFSSMEHNRLPAILELCDFGRTTLPNRTIVKPTSTSPDLHVVIDRDARCDITVIFAVIARSAFHLQTNLLEINILPCHSSQLMRNY